MEGQGLVWIGLKVEVVVTGQLEARLNKDLPFIMKGMSLYRKIAYGFLTHKRIRKRFLFISLMRPYFIRIGESMG